MLLRTHVRLCGRSHALLKPPEGTYSDGHIDIIIFWCVALVSSSLLHLRRSLNLLALSFSLVDFACSMHTHECCCLLFLAFLRDEGWGKGITRKRERVRNASRRPPVRVPESFDDETRSGPLRLYSPSDSCSTLLAASLRDRDEKIKREGEITKKRRKKMWKKRRRRSGGEKKSWRVLMALGQKRPTALCSLFSLPRLFPTIPSRPFIPHRARSAIFTRFTNVTRAHDLMTKKKSTHLRCARVANFLGYAFVRQIQLFLDTFVRLEIIQNATIDRRIIQSTELIDSITCVIYFRAANLKWNKKSTRTIPWRRLTSIYYSRNYILIKSLSSEYNGSRCESPMNRTSNGTSFASIYTHVYINIGLCVGWAPSYADDNALQPRGIVCFAFIVSLLLPSFSLVIFFLPSLLSISPSLPAAFFRKSSLFFPVKIVFSFPGQSLVSFGFLAHLFRAHTEVYHP